MQAAFDTLGDGDAEGKRILWLPLPGLQLSGQIEVAKEFIDRAKNADARCGTRRSGWPRWLQEAQQEKENDIREAPQAQARLEGLQAEVSTVSRGECPKWVKGVGGGHRSFPSRVVAGATSSTDEFEQMRAELVQLRRK